MYTCKGRCQKFKASGEFQSEGRYLGGQKRCRVCGLFITFEGLRCPCCSCKLRTVPRSTRGRKVIQSERKIKKY